MHLSVNPCVFLLLLLAPFFQITDSRKPESTSTSRGRRRCDGLGPSLGCVTAGQESPEC